MISGVVVALHVVSVFWLVAGIVGRDVAWHQARRAGATGVLASAMRGWPVLGTLQGGASNWVLAAPARYVTLIPVIALVFVPRLAVLE